MLPEPVFFHLPHYKIGLHHISKCISNRKAHVPVITMSHKSFFFFFFLGDIDAATAKLFP